MLKSFPILVGAAALIVGGIALPKPSHAVVIGIFSDNIGVNCSAGCGTVTVTEPTAGTYHFIVDLNANTLVLHSTPGNPDTVAFNLAGATTATGPVTSPVDHSVPMDGFGNFLAGVDCSTQIAGNICVPNGVSPANELIFDVTATAGQLANINVSNFLALDVAQASNTANTGFAGVPAPAIGHGLLVLLAVGGILCGGKILESLKKHRLQAA